MSWMSILTSIVIELLSMILYCNVSKIHYVDAISNDIAAKAKLLYY
jgi:hypothetical protein